MSKGVESKTIGRVSELTLITPIKQGFVAGSDLAEPPLRYVERLRAALESVEGLPRPSGLDYIATVHFARWVIFDDDRKLLFTSNFDGGWEQYLRDFCALVPRYVDGIWGNCVGYPGAGNYDAFIEWVRRHQVKTTLFYAAIPDLTVRDLLWLKGFKAHYDAFERATEQMDVSTWPEALRTAYSEMQRQVGKLDLTVIGSADAAPSAGDGALS